MNFQDFFQLRESPFGETPDTRFFYPSQAHREALQKASWAVEENKAFVLITGEAGSGKTILSRVLHDCFANEAHLAMVVNPVMTPEALLHAICHDFGIESSSTHTLQTLSDWLTKGAGEGKRSLLIIDEAQTISFECLEFIRLLTNLETSNRKLLQVILIGQPELEKRLEQPNLKQLQQRIFLRIKLSALTLEETTGYIRHRIERAGGGNFVRFDLSSLRKIQRLSGGTPRVVNKICEAALRFAALEQRRHIDSSHIKALPLSQMGIKPSFFSAFRRTQLR